MRSCSKSADSSPPNSESNPSNSSNSKPDGKRGKEAITKQRDLVEELIGEEAENAHTHKPESTHNILNEVVVDRGPSPTMSTIELFGDDEHFTTVLADGLCIATPTVRIVLDSFYFPFPHSSGDLPIWLLCFPGFIAYLSNLPLLSLSISPF